MHSLLQLDEFGVLKWEKQRGEQPSQITPSRYDSVAVA